MARDVGCTVAELPHRMSLPELARWADFYAWEVKVRNEAAAEAIEEARREAEVQAQLSGYRR